MRIGESKKNGSSRVLSTVTALSQQLANLVKSMKKASLCHTTKKCLTRLTVTGILSRNFNFFWRDKSKIRLQIF